MLNVKAHVKGLDQFGFIAVQGVHQILTNERDVEHAFETAARDGYTNIFFYIIRPNGADIAELLAKVELYQLRFG